MCRVARTLRFSRLKVIANKVATYFQAENPSAALLRRSLHEYKVKCYKRKQKSFVNLRQMCYQSRILCGWTADQWKDISFPDEC